MPDTTSCREPRRSHRQIDGALDEGGNLSAIVVEAAAHEGEAWFRLLADALPIGVWMSDAKGHRTYFNRAWLDFTGADSDRHAGDGWRDSLHPNDRNRYLTAYRAALRQREPFSVDYRLRRHDGRYGWFTDRAVPRCSADGTFLGLTGGSLDVTDARENELRLRDLTGRVITAEEEDRRRIARDLHDDVSQLIALLAIEIEQLALTPIQDQSELAAKARAMWRRTAQIATEVHRISHALHPSRLETFGLAAAIEGLCAEITRQHQVRVVFSKKHVPHPLPPDVTLCLFRIAQEALNNVCRHSGAHDASVELTGGRDRVRLRVSDKGRGFDTSSRSGGLGLVSMRERVRFAGGDLNVESRPGEGTRIDVELPLVAVEEVAAEDSRPQT